MAIVVTGFGPFGSYKTNASWECVKGLPDVWTDPDHPITVEEIPVQYKFVQEEMPNRWAKIDPIFVVHVGVSHLADKITLETQAHNDGYNNKDIDNCVPKNYLCVSCGPGEIQSTFDLASVCDEVNRDSESQGREGCKIASWGVIT